MPSTIRRPTKRSVYTVAIGSQFAIPDTNLAIKVENFLPHFTMAGAVRTSQSNEPKNPAARVRIYEDGKEIFNGWLFSLFPTTHAYAAPEVWIYPGGLHTRPLAHMYAPVAQLDRASDYGSEGREFESLRARHKNKGLGDFA